MRDWTRAVVFGWVGSGSCGAAYRRQLLGRSTQKVWFTGLAARERSRPQNRRSAPSHPSVRHYDRSELMKLTNLRCGKATPERVPSPHQGLPLPLSQRLERVRSGPRAGALIEQSAQGAPRGDHPNTTIAPKRRPPPLKGQTASINPARLRVRDAYVCARRWRFFLCELRSRSASHAPHPVTLRVPTLPTRESVKIRLFRQSLTQTNRRPGEPGPPLDQFKKEPKPPALRRGSP